MMKLSPNIPLLWAAAAARMVALNAAFSVAALAASLELANDPATAGPGQFAAEEIRRAASARGLTLASAADNPMANAMRIVLAVDASDGTNRPAQSYRIRVNNDKGRRTLSVLGADATGAMYGGLDIAEAMRTGTLDSLKDSDHTPYIARRGIKFNLPLDLRTPSYTDCSDAAQANIPVMWEREFWTDFLERHPDPGPRPWVIRKQWYAFLLWGRLAYDPSLPDSRFERLLAARHPMASSPHLFRALQGASRIMPLTTRFFWGDIDLKWYPEACLSHPKSKGFYTVRHFIEGITMPGAAVLCIRDWRARLTARQPMEQTTPLEIADALDGAVAETLASLDALRETAKVDSELRKTVADCEALAWLGRYYASKIRGACALALFDVNGDQFEHAAALRHLGDALTHWQRYAAIRDAHYVPALYNRVGHVNVTALTDKVAADLDLAQNWKPGSLKDDGRRSGSEKGFRK